MGVVPTRGWLTGVVLMYWSELLVCFTMWVRLSCLMWLKVGFIRLTARLHKKLLQPTVHLVLITTCKMPITLNVPLLVLPIPYTDRPQVSPVESTEYFGQITKSAHQLPLMS